MYNRAVGRVLVVLVVAVTFGVLESLAKGSGSGVRDVIGNLSAPWVILPLVAGSAASRGRLLPGAAVGLLATIVALAGFYVANAFVLDLGPHSTLHDLGLTLNVGNLWFKAGAISGPVMGAAGAWLIRRGRFAVVVAVVGIVVFEPLAVYAAYLASNGRFAAGNGEWNGIYAAQAGLGAIAAVVLWRSHSIRRR